MPALRPRALIISAAAAGALAVPAGAQAATFTVGAGQGGCAGEDRSCETLTLANAAAGSGDRIEVAAGTYEGATITKPNLFITGPAGFPQTVAFSSPLVLTSTAGSDTVVANAAVLTSAAGPAIDVQGASNINLRDALVISGSNHALQLANSTASQVTRSRVYSGGGEGAAIQFTPKAGPAKTLTIDASVLSGVYGLHLVSTGLATGAITVTGTHATVVGSAHALTLDASNGGLLDGPINSTFTDSLIQGNVETRTGILINVTSTIDPNKNDLATPPDKLFVNAASRDYSLRADAPVIGRGSAPASDITDVDGQVRKAGELTDYGADEFVNSAPVAKISADKPEVRQNAPVTFSAAGSSDRDGPLKEYRWTFSDGSAQTTSTPTVTKAFPNEGQAGAALQVLDGQGSLSAPANIAIKVLDGLAPIVLIESPVANKTLSIFRTTTKTTTKTVTKNGKKVKQKTKKTTKRRASIAFQGRAADKSGVDKVIVTIRQITRTATKKTPAKKKTTAKKPTTKKPTAKKSQASGTCRWLRPGRGVVGRSCSNPILIEATLDAKGVTANWTYKIPTTTKLTPGTWEIAAIGSDAAGAVGNSNPKGTIRFKLK